MSGRLGWIEEGETHTFISPFRLYSSTVADEKKKKRGKKSEVCTTELNGGVHGGEKGENPGSS